jgi:hypothetical protein
MFGILMPSSFPSLLCMIISILVTLIMPILQVKNSPISKYHCEAYGADDVNYHLAASPISAATTSLFWKNH